MMEGVRGILAVWSCLPCRIFWHYFDHAQQPASVLPWHRLTLSLKKFKKYFF